MRHEHLRNLTCPGTSHDLELENGAVESEGEVRAGTLACKQDGTRIPIKNFIPRFREDNGYAASFGEQWNRFRRTQIDKFNGTTLTRDRFYSGTGWNPSELRGKRILEGGCGAGRFTEIMLDAGADVYSLDYSNAVDAAFANCGPHPNLCMMQANIYGIPFRLASFDYVFCYGVLQHTPDVKRAFMSLIPFLKPGGKLAVDVYKKGWAFEPYKSKYLYRPITTRISRDRLFRFLEWYIRKWFPADTLIKKIPLFGRAFGMLIPCWNYSYLPLTNQQRVEWGILDTFDALASKYDYPQTKQTVENWFREAGLSDIHVRTGGNGILGNGTRPK